MPPTAAAAEVPVYHVGKSGYYHNPYATCDSNVMGAVTPVEDISDSGSDIEVLDSGSSGHLSTCSRSATAYCPPLRGCPTTPPPHSSADPPPSPPAMYPNSTTIYIVHTTDPFATSDDSTTALLDARCVHIVQFPSGRRACFRYHEVVPDGAFVLVEAVEGYDMGEIVGQQTYPAPGTMPCIVRPAEDVEVLNLSAIAQQEQEVQAAAQQLAFKAGLDDVTIDRAEIQYDGSRITLHFSSPKMRPDFRELLAQCSAMWDARIYFARSHVDPYHGQPLIKSHNPYVETVNETYLPPPPDLLDHMPLPCQEWDAQ